MGLLDTSFEYGLIYLLYKGDEIKSGQAKYIKCTFIHSISSHPPIHSLISPINTKCGVSTEIAYIAKPQLMSSKNSQSGEGEVLFMLLSILTLVTLNVVGYLTQAGHQGRLLAVLTLKKILKVGQESGEVSKVSK